MAKKRYATKATPEEIEAFFELRNRGLGVAEATRRLNRTRQWGYNIEKRAAEEEAPRHKDPTAHEGHWFNKDTLIREHDAELRLEKDGLALVAAWNKADARAMSVLWTRYAGRERQFAGSVANAALLFVNALAQETGRTPAEVIEGAAESLRTDQDTRRQEFRDELDCDCHDCRVLRGQAIGAAPDDD